MKLFKSRTTIDQAPSAEFASAYNSTFDADSSFYERYYQALRRGRLAPHIGRIAVHEMDVLDQRFFAEMASGFSEALTGRVNTHYIFDVQGDKILAGDGEELEAMMLRSLDNVNELAQNMPEMSFVVDRSKAEVAELYDQQAMARGETPYNTIITSSPMTFELQDQPQLLKSGFQRPDLKRSMVRISHWDGHKMHILTRSLDNGTLELFLSAVEQATDHDFGEKHSTKSLNDRIHKSLDLGQVKILLDLICVVYDRLMYEETGKQTTQGAVEPDNIDLLKFVEDHRDILQNLRREAQHLAQKCSTYEEFDALFGRATYGHLALFDSILHGGSYDSDSITASAGDAGVNAAEDGKYYSMCGEIVSPSESIVATLGLQTGFESLMAYSGVRQQCPNRDCRKMVIVEDKHLREGILHCRECHLTVSVCGEDRKADKVRAEAVKIRRTKQLALAKKAQKINNPRTHDRHNQRTLTKV